MSLNLKSSGGGSVTVDVPSTASNYTATLPAANGIVQVSSNQPAFSATRTTNQSITSGVVTKVQYDTENFDTNSCYDAATNYRFTPNVEGYYQINASIYMVSTGTPSTGALYIYKNGADYARVVSRYTSVSTTVYGQMCITDLIYFNGTTDYVEVYGSVTGTGVGFGASGNFAGVLVRAA